MAYKVERNVFLDGTEYGIGDTVDLPNDERTKGLVESGTLSVTDAKAKATPAAEVDNKGVDNSTPPLSESAADGQPEQPTESVASEPQQPNTPEAPASSSINLHLG